MRTNTFLAISLVLLACLFLGSQGELAAGATTVQKYSDNVMNTYGRYPLTISHGKGCLLYDSEGKEFLDFASGIATCCLGHSHPKLIAAISNQMNRIHHCSNLYFIPQQANLAEWLVKNSCADKAFFCNSGAEANEAAIKLARKYAHSKLGIRSPVILTAKNSFHGRTLATVTATGQPKYHKDFDPLVPGFEYVEYNDIDDLKRAVASITKKNNDEDGDGKGRGLAAIMMEPLQGEGGVRPGDKAFFRAIRQICDESGALMIVDEVQTGMGRTGKLWGYQNLDIEPDIITNAKALGGGVPIGVMLCKEKCNVFQPGDHASTYGGNPLACAAGLAVAEVFDEEGLVAQVADKGELFRSLAVELLQKRFPSIVKEVRGWGLMNGVQLFEESKLTAADITKQLMTVGGVLVVPAGPKVVRFVPPLIVSKEEIRRCLQKVSEAIQQLQ